MATPITQGYAEMTTAVASATRVIDHESFPSKFEHAPVAEMVRDVFAELKGVFASDSILHFDSSLASDRPGVDPDGWLNSMAAAEVARLLDSLTDVAYEQDKVTNPRILSSFRRAVTRLLEEMYQFIAQAPTAAHPDASLLLQKALSRLANMEVQEASRLLDVAVTKIQEHQEKAEASAAAASAAAGKTGDSAMSSFYATLAKTEADSADKFRRFTVGFAIAGGVLALIFVLLPTGIFPQLDAGANDYVRLIQKAVLIAGIFGIAGYFARQAHQHRSMANWAESLSVQLQTFDAYVQAVDSAEVKDELRKNFAARAFGDHPAMKGEPTVTPSAAAMDTAVGWAAKLTAGGGGK